MDKKKQALIDAYDEVLETPAGREVLKDLITKFSVTVPVYAFGSLNELSDIAYRDGQRNCGTYVYNLMAFAAPKITTEIFAEVMMEENNKLLETKEGGEDESV